MRTRRTGTNTKTNGSTASRSVRTTNNNNNKRTNGKNDYSHIAGSGTNDANNNDNNTATSANDAVRPVVVTPPSVVKDPPVASSTITSKKRRTQVPNVDENNNKNETNYDSVESLMDDEDGAAVPNERSVTSQRNNKTTTTTRRGRTRASSSSDQPAAASAAAEAPVAERVVPESVRARQRAVAEREASRLARPEQRIQRSIGHADRKKSAVTSTPFGIFPTASATKIIDGISTTEWCGPFSIARQMIAKREELKRKKQAEEEEDEEGNGTRKESHPLDVMMVEIENDKKRKAHPSLQWKGSIGSSKQQQATVQDNLYTKRKKRNDVYSSTKKIPTLFQVCVNYIVQNIEHVESLGDATIIDSDIRSSIVQELINYNQFNTSTLQIICEPGIETLEIIDCCAITQSDLSDQLQKLIPSGLRYLVLDQAGRCFGPTTVSSIINTLSQASDNKDTNASSSSLHALSIGGAYLLTDADAARLIQVTADTGLTSLEFKGCPLLGTLTLTSINESYTKNNNKLLELSLVDITWTETDQIKALVSTPDAFRHLQNLTLRNITGLNDTIMEQLLKMTSNSLIGFDISHNIDITDDTLSSLRNYGSPNLISLRLNSLRNITSSGLEATFMILTNEYGDANNNGTESDVAANPSATSPPPPPPRLRHLELGNLYHDAVTDDVIQQVALASKISSTTSDKLYNNGTANPSSFLATTAGGGGTGGLVTLNIQGASTVTDTSMEVLVSTCGTTLVDLNVSFCTKITNQGLGYLVDNCESQLSKISIWGNAQLSDEFLDGHHRTNDPTFRIVGNWMKHFTN